MHSLFGWRLCQSWTLFWGCQPVRNNCPSRGSEQGESPVWVLGICSLLGGLPAEFCAVAYIAEDALYYNKVKQIFLRTSTQIRKWHLLFKRLTDFKSAATQPYSKYDYVEAFQLAYLMSGCTSETIARLQRRASLTRSAWSDVRVEPPPSCAKARGRSTGLTRSRKHPRSKSQGEVLSSDGIPVQLVRFITQSSVSDTAWTICWLLP